MNQRERFSGRLGFILLSAGCAIGIGNVYKFPIMTGYYGGGFFLLFYLLFLLILGVPIMTMELSIGRASQSSFAHTFDILQKPKHKWNLWKYGSIVGNYALMMCYVVIVSWIAIYFGKFITGSISSATTVEALGDTFGGVVSAPGLQTVVSFVIIIVCFAICALGLKNGVERASKVLMVMLLLIIVGMGVYCSTAMSGAKEGIAFYLIPSLSRLKEVGVMNTIEAAMAQAFFTLSLGMGNIAIFGSYIEKDRALMGEGIVIIILDTFVALMSGFIIFPACYTYAGSVQADGSVGASFVFTTFSSVFNNMKGGRILGIFFFALLLFAAVSTVLAVFENIVAYWQDTTKISRPVICLINIGIICLGVLPAILGNNVWSDFTIFGQAVLDFEDGLVSKFILPFGSLLICLFCSLRFGWGYDKFLEEANTGKGPKFPRWAKPYCQFVLPLIIAVVMILSFV